MKEALTNEIMRNYVSQNSFLTIDGKKEYPQYSVTISDHHQNFCIGLVDIVNSTTSITKLRQTQIGTYYEIFLNSIVKILVRFGGVIIKNIGDCLLFFFPESTHQNRKYGFRSCLECALTMTEEHEIIKKELIDVGLPTMNYRISIDYGNVFVMKSNDGSFDLVGTPVNICAKMNHFAQPNGIVIGGDLYEVTRKFSDYNFDKLQGFSVLGKKSYPMYSIRRNKK